MSRALLTRVTVVFAACLSVAANALPAASSELHIPPGPLVPALESLSKQMTVQLVYQPQQLESFSTRGVSGSYTAKEAVRLLIRGTPVQLLTDSATGAMAIIPEGATRDVAAAGGSRSKGIDPPKGARDDDSRGGFRLAEVARAQAEGESAPVDPPAAGAAQPAIQLARLQTVTVTGSRVITNATLSPTPVTTVSVQQLEAMDPGPVSGALSQLPALMATPNQGGQGPGPQAVFDLRGLGGTRNLILFDGFRVAPTTGQQGVDTNLIPQLLLQRVDVVTGGASAVYGSDAVSGVINYVINNNFNGMEVSVQRGESTYQDDKKWNAGLAAGTSLFGGRGHIEASVQFFNDPGIPNRFARSWGRALWSTQGSVPGSTASPGTAANPYALYANTRLSKTTFGGLISSGPLAGLQFAENGVLSPFVNGEPTGSSGAQIGGSGAYYTDVWSYDGLNMGQGFGRFDYDVTDSTKAYVEVAVGSSTYTAGTNNYTITNQSIGYNNAYLAGVAGIQPQYQATIASELAADPLSSFSFNKMTTATDNFSAEIHQTHEVQDLAIAGLDGLWGRYKWQLGYEWQRSVTTSPNTDNIILPRLYAAMNAVQDPATGQVVCNAALVNPAVYAGCVPLNVFGPSASSRAAMNYIMTSSKSWTTYGMHNVTASLIGSPFDDWAGAVDMAWSADWRRLSYGVASTALPSTPVDCTGIQFNCNAGTKYYSNSTSAFPTASEEVAETAYETEVPLLKDEFLAKSLALNGAARFTHYTTSGSVWTWKLGATWALDDAFLIRVTRSYDIRAPGLQDLYAPATYVNVPLLDLHTGVSGSVLDLSEGNRNLKPEKASTWTAGFVWSPQFFDGGKLSIDFYHIDIGDALVGLATRQPATQEACDNSGGTSPVCSLYIRPHPFSDASADNFPTELIEQELNSAGLLAYGIDTELDYMHVIAGHHLLARLLLTYEPHLIYDLGPAGTVDAGDAADGIGGLSATPSVRGVLSANYELTPDLSVAAQERFRNGMKQNGSAALYFAVPPLGPAYYTDLTLSYNHDVGDGTLSLFLNVKNVFNKQPQAWASSGGNGQIGAFGGYSVIDDGVGRYFTLGMRYRIK